MPNGNEIIETLYEGLNEGRLEVIDELVDPGLVLHAAPVDEKTPDIERFRDFHTELRAAFPDLSFTVEAVVSEGDLVAERTIMSGTQEGDFLGLPATKNQISLTSVSMSRIENGKIIERWGAVGGWA